MINREIKSEFVKVINPDGSGVTEMSLTAAIEFAEKTDEDVILINNKTDIPIVKIADYSKYMYERQKKEKEAAKKQKSKSNTTKEIQISDSISEHDLLTKAHNVDRLLHEGYKINIVIRYKGRSIKFISGGSDKIHYLVSKVTERYRVDKEAKIEGNKVSMTISPCK
jgi:translation initiation factor IF-3